MADFSNFAAQQRVGDANQAIHLGGGIGGGVLGRVQHYLEVVVWNGKFLIFSHGAVMGEESANLVWGHGYQCIGVELVRGLFPHFLGHLSVQYTNKLLSQKVIPSFEMQYSRRFLNEKHMADNGQLLEHD